MLSVPRVARDNVTSTAFAIYFMLRRGQIRYNWHGFR
jgi:hypothetical protein